MRPYRNPKISLKKDYPCPCRRRGCLKPIILTEALGCDRCQQIFVVKEDGQVIEQLSSIYQKQAWRWTGYRWASVYPGFNNKSLSALFTVIVLLPIITAIVLPLVLQRFSSDHIIFWAIACSLLIATLIIVLWLAYRH
ncbi:MAG: hypothetical protein QNJ70_00580 [Xenococcaceae cyanobacterium MO_207.B15]|nr:hypothetical protein [Xenococcaceae cyanobacterium MO_207.B15]MDJ0743988.1 hypothetical protein [Xenococcaceae cyanobacterium MO_167.B27]